MGRVVGSQPQILVEPGTHVRAKSGLTAGRFSRPLREGSGAECGARPMRALGPAPRAPISLSARRRHGALGQSRPACDRQSQREESRFWRTRPAGARQKLLQPPILLVRRVQSLGIGDIHPRRTRSSNCIGWLPILRTSSTNRPAAGPDDLLFRKARSLHRPSPQWAGLEYPVEAKLRGRAPPASARDGDWAAADRASLADRATRLIRRKRLAQPGLDLGMRGITPAMIGVGERGRTHRRHGLKCKSGNLGGTAERRGARKNSRRISKSRRFTKRDIGVLRSGV